MPFDDASFDATDDLDQIDDDDEDIDNVVDIDEADATFEYRVNLNFDTSFTGEDRLRIRLRASDAAGSLANTESGFVQSERSHRWP